MTINISNRPGCMRARHYVPVHVGYLLNGIRQNVPWPSSSPMPSAGDLISISISTIADMGLDDHVCKLRVVRVHHFLNITTDGKTVDSTCSSNIDTERVTE